MMYYYEVYGFGKSGLIDKMEDNMNMDKRSEG